ncbi:hypothetical protein TNCV_2946381 [Trichonephila clavipes]|nr:hypothetical protein TNCV_2946381 [Trichonephila clavipes]
MMYRISISETLAKRNEIDPFFKRMVTGDEKWVTYDNIKQKRFCLKHGEATQTVAKPGRFYSAFGETGKKVLIISSKHYIRISAVNN